MSLERRDGYIEALMNPRVVCRTCADFVRLDDYMEHIMAHKPDETPL